MLRRISFRLISTNQLRRSLCTKPSELEYTQGQYDGSTREYFYYIDHNGQLFLDDSRMKNFTSCFKEQKFLRFFYRHIRPNQTPRYRAHFPFVSYCQGERNFVRCDDSPIVFTQLNLGFNAGVLGLDEGPKIKPEPPANQMSEAIIKRRRRRKLDHPENVDTLQMNHVGLMKVQFDPSRVFMLPDTGRVYYPLDQEDSQRLGPVGLVRSQLAIQLSTYFHFPLDGRPQPNAIDWGGSRVPLRNDLATAILDFHYRFPPHKLSRD